MDKEQPHTVFSLLTLGQAVELLGVSRATIDRWRQHKGLPSIKIGRDVYFDRDELQLWVREQSSAGRPVRDVQVSSGPLSMTIGYQSGTAHMWSSLIIKGLRLLEEELSLLRPFRPVEVRWRDAANGLELVEGLIAGKVQIAALGDYPIAMSASFGRVLPKFSPVLLAFDGKAERGRGISVAVPRQARLRDLSDLAERTIATVPHSSAGHRLTGLLTSLGTPARQVIHQEMPESLRSIASERVGASVMWEPYPSLLDYYGQGRLLFSEGLGDDYLTGLAADQAWVRAHEDLTVAYLKAHLRAHAFLRSEPLKAAKLVARAADIPVKVAGQVLSRVRWDAAVYTRDLETLQGFLDGTPLPAPGLPLDLHQPGPAYRGEYLQAAARQLRLPAIGDGPALGDWSKRVLL
ncbi:NitT/TauT family transport system substrate-binding protein [Paenibacillus mucilaginosus]|uniref:helix-turn-helix domain-containing protein n=1 Tax=Paenibacillus mucilaginosus TaxID=61624 RepID=UPI003D21093E